MNITAEILKTIVLAGQIGTNLTKLAGELGVMTYEIDDARKENTDFDEAMKLYERNFKQFTFDKLHAQAISGKNPALSRELFAHLIKDLEPNDNEIIIKIVE